MQKGKMNNNLLLFDNKYKGMYDEIMTDGSKRKYYTNIFNDITQHPKELVDFCKDELGQISKGANGLILGGGYGREENRTKIVYPDFNLYSLDISAWGEKIGKELNDALNVHFVTGDMCRPLFDDDFFSFIFSLHSLEHTPDIDQTMSEVFRTTKDGGIFGLAYPYMWPTDEQHVYSFEDDMEEYMLKFGHVTMGESNDHQSKILKIRIRK